jgi:hypothetical protein
VGNKFAISARMQSKNTVAKAKFDSPDAQFRLMNYEGRRSGSTEYWQEKTRAEKISFCKWLKDKHKILTRTQFRKVLPVALIGFVSDNDLWAEIGLGDMRLRNERPKKPKKDESAKLEARRQAEIKRLKSAKKRGAKRSFSEKQAEIDSNPISPLSTGNGEHSYLFQRKLTPPLKEPEFRLWSEAIPFEQESMVDELMEYSRKAEIYCIRKLLSMGVPVDARNKEGETALMQVAFCGWAKLFKLLLNEYKADINVENKRGEYVSTYAIEGGCKEIISITLKKKAKLNADAAKIARAEGDSRLAKRLEEALGRQSRAR